MIYADTDGTIRRWNAAAALFGYSSEQALGQRLDLIIPDSLRAAHWSGFDQAMAQGVTRLHSRPTTGGRSTIGRICEQKAATR